VNIPAKPVSVGRVACDPVDAKFLWHTTYIIMAYDLYYYGIRLILLWHTTFFLKKWHVKGPVVLPWNLRATSQDTLMYLGEL